MNTSNRNLLGLALTAILLSPAVAAQGLGKGPPETPPVAPVPSVDVPNSPEQTQREIRPQTTEQTTNEAPPPSPPQSQGAEHAATHSSVVQRDVWTRLDSDGDGRISSAEGAVDTGFNAGFEAMDADRDGFVSDTEYRASAKAEMERGHGTADVPERAASSLGDVMRRLDANADGSISSSEGNADATFKTHFAAIDANSDGAVSRAEYQAWLKANRK